MQDHNLSIGQGKSEGNQSVGQSNDTNFSSDPATSGLDPHRPWGCFAERAFVYVDCYFARNGFRGRDWSRQLFAECEQRHQDFLNVTAARRAFGPAVIPYGLLLRLFFIGAVLLGLLSLGDRKAAERPLSFFTSSRVLQPGSRAFGDESAEGEETCSPRRFCSEVLA